MTLYSTYACRSSLFWEVTQRGLVISYRRFEATCPSHLQGSSNQRSSSWTACPETSVTNYRSTLCNNPEERRNHLHCGGSMKSRTFERLQENLWIVLRAPYTLKSHIHPKLNCVKKTARETELNVLWHSTGFPSGLSVLCVFLCVWLWWIKTRLSFAVC